MTVCDHSRNRPLQERTEHSIDPVIRTAILEPLRASEDEHHVQVRYACASGSRGWGFASPDSDDVRVLDVHARLWYLRVTPGRDVIERPLTAVLDINGWALQRRWGC